jgi:hypothetical protein
MEPDVGGETPGEYGYGHEEGRKEQAENLNGMPTIEKTLVSILSNPCQVQVADGSMTVGRELTRTLFLFDFIIITY